jgi:hypothetical protein
VEIENPRSIIQGGNVLSQFKTVVISVAFASLAACGGGGSGGAAGPVASTNSFALKAAYQALNSAGWSKTYAISGTCTGSLTLTEGALSTSTTFEGAPALSGNSVGSFSFSNCVPSSSSQTQTRYTDASYLPRGYSESGGDYAVFAGTPNIPDIVKVGDVVVVGSYNIYTDSTKAVSAGRDDISFAVEPDTATTAIINLVSNVYNTSGVLTYTQQERFRMSASGALTPISLDAQASNGSTTHLIGS